jgi:hypothetical protein
MSSKRAAQALKMTASVRAPRQTLGWTTGEVRRRHFGPTSTLAVACILFSLSYRDGACAFSSDAPSPPSVEFGELYDAVEMSGLFSDQKTFADAIPDEPPSQIVANTRSRNNCPAST